MTKTDVHRKIDGTLDKFINEDNAQDSVDKPKLTLEDNVLTLYKTRIAQKSDGNVVVMEKPTEAILVDGKLNDNAKWTTEVVIERLHEKLDDAILKKQKIEKVEKVPFHQDYPESLSKLQSDPSATPSAATASLASAPVAAPAPAAPANTAPGSPAAPQKSHDDNKFYRNIMISGTPGCGKSHFVDRYAIPAIVGNDDDQSCRDHTTRVVFTEGYTYEDFFGCYKPRKAKDASGITFDFAPGPFCRIVSQALQRGQENFVLVIEEMNRGNAYEIFGSLFQLLDRHEGNVPKNASLGQSVYSIALSEDAADWFRQQGLAQVNAEQFVLPGNLYIIATVNNADSRVQFMDTAMKRRFHAAYMDEEGILYGTPGIPGIKTYAFEDGKSAAKHTENVLLNKEYHKLRAAINEQLTADNQLEDKLIAKHFARMDEKGAINHVDFITNILGYLIQNVYRGRSLPTAIFQDPDHRSLGQLLKVYFMSGEKLDAILKRSSDADENS